MARPPLFLRGQGCCVEFAWNSRDGLLGEHIEAALGSHDVELVSIAATSIVSHNGCHSTALPGRNCTSCWRWLTWKGTETTGVAKRGCHEHGLAVVTRFGVASPLLFVLFVALLEDSTSGNSGPGRNPSVEQQSGASSSFQTSDGLPAGSVACNSYHSTGQYVTFIFKSAHLRHFTVHPRYLSIERGHGKSRAKSVTAQVFLVALSWLRPVLTWRHFLCPSFRPTLAQWVLSHLNRACWLGVWPPLQISSHCTHVLPKLAFRTVVLVTLQL